MEQDSQNQLFDYVRHARSMGLSDEKIRMELIRDAWPLNDVDMALNMPADASPEPFNVKPSFQDSTKVNVKKTEISMTDEERQKSEWREKYQRLDHDESLKTTAEKAVGSAQPLVEKNGPRIKINQIVIIGLIVGAISLAHELNKDFHAAPAVGRTVTQFMIFASEKNFQEAYNLTSSKFRSSVTLNDFVNTMTALNGQYSGFQRQEQTNFFVKIGISGPGYIYSAKVTYTNGDTGTLSATLLRENGLYKINGIDINITPQRFNEFQ